MPWVMAAMTAAQMMQAESNRQNKKEVDAAGIRYSPWTGVRDLPDNPSTWANTAQQGATGIAGFMNQNQNNQDQSRLNEAQINFYNRIGAPDGSGQGSVPRGYEADQMGGADFYMSKDPYHRMMEQKQRRVN